jgi:hypothetical protein
MKLVFRVNRIYVKIFSGILLAVIVLPLIITAMQYDVSKTEIIAVLGIFYLAYSPVIILLIFLIVYYSRGHITLDGEKMEYRFAREKTILSWEKINEFVYDSICVKNPRFNIDRYYLLYEAGDGTEKIRFNRLLSKREREGLEDFHTVNPFKKKAFRFRTYGLYLHRKDCESLVNYIRDYTEIEPVRKTGLF